jgi:MFS transporter, DHA1 family, multidrug resistance protein
MERKTELKFLLLTIFVFIAACVETDIYLPALADMMQFFKVTEDKIQSLLTWNFVGICLSGPFYGPLSDAFGRKKPLLIALVLFFLGSLLTLFTNSFEVMLWGRILQGLGSGGCFTLGTALIFDVFQKEKAVDAVAKLNSTIPFLMAGAPLLGGYLNQTFGFRSNFLAITLIVLLCLGVCLFFLGETLPKEQRSPLQLSSILRDFKEILLNGPFWQLTCIICLIFAGYLTFLSGSAILFVLEFGISKQLFPFYQASLLVAWLIASLLFSRAVKRFGARRVKAVGAGTIALGGVGLSIVTALFPQDALLLTASMVFFAFGANWVSGIYFPEVMEIFPKIKGIAASLLTSLRLLITAGVVGLTSSLYNGTIYPIAVSVIAILAVTFVLIVLYERRTRPVLLENGE